MRSKRTQQKSSNKTKPAISTDDDNTKNADNIENVAYSPFSGRRITLPEREESHDDDDEDPFQLADALIEATAKGSRGATGNATNHSIHSGNNNKSRRAESPGKKSADPFGGFYSPPSSSSSSASAGGWPGAAGDSGKVKAATRSGPASGKGASNDWPDSSSWGDNSNFFGNAATTKEEPFPPVDGFSSKKNSSSRKIQSSEGGFPLESGGKSRSAGVRDGKKSGGVKKRTGNKQNAEDSGGFAPLFNDEEWGPGEDDFFGRR